MSKREAKLCFDDIKDSILKIEKYTKGLSYDEFVDDPMRVDAVKICRFLKNRLTNY